MHTTNVTDPTPDNLLPISDSVAKARLNEAFDDAEAAIADLTMALSFCPADNAADYDFYWALREAAARRAEAKR